MDLFNCTPFAVQEALFLDGSGVERLLVVVKATFSVEGPKPAVAAEQMPVVLGDTYRGEAGKSSLIAASDLAPMKPATDVLLEGCAYTTAKSRSEAVVGFRVGELKKAIRVLGDRVWRGVVFASPSPPEPFVKKELSWERAFGGTDDSKPGKMRRCEENPVGRGYRARGSNREVAGSPLPNQEDLRKFIDSPGDRPPPAGFGPIAPDWQPRVSHAGTFDERWMRERRPFPPADLGERFFLTAPPDQVYPGYVKGGEPVRVLGATPEGQIDFALPEVTPEVALRLGRSREVLPCQCDTVVIDCERKQVSMVWRASVVVQGRLPSLHWVKVSAPEASLAA